MIQGIANICAFIGILIASAYLLRVLVLAIMKAYFWYQAKRDEKSKIRKQD